MSRKIQGYEIEKREFIRMDMVLPVEYRFIDCADPNRYPEIYQGKTENLSGGGLLLHGTIPHTSWVPDLLMGKILVGLKIHLPDSSVLKSVGKMAWVEKRGDGTCLLGVRFKEMTYRDQDRLIQMVIERHLP